MTGSKPTPDHESGGDNPPAALAIDDVSFSYGATRALTDCSFDVRRGTIHALLGENGCGKSTLVKILGGVLSPDMGRVICNKTDARFSSPRQARHAGIAAVYQETLIAPDLSVRDNIELGSDGFLRRRTSAAERDQVARAVLDELGLHDVSLGTEAAQLPLSHRHLVTVARALVNPWRVLVLDEATAALDIGYRRLLFALLRRLTDKQHAVLFISHRFDELFELADNITVLRSGRTVGTVKTALTSKDALLSMMSPASADAADGGAEAVASRARRAFSGNDEPAVTVRGLCLRPGAAPFDLDVSAGEILGLAGLEGHGQADMVQVVAGRVRPASGEVVVRVGDRRHRVRGVRSAVASGVSYGPVDRKRDGIFPGLSITDNLMMTSFGSVARLGMVSARRSRARAQSLAERFRVQPAGLKAPIDSLSGGNQQKVLLGRWLATAPRVLALNDPMRGVDVSAKAEIMRALDELVADGLSIIMVSTEVQELMEFCDRVGVFRLHTLGAVLEGDDLREREIIAAMVGAFDTDANATEPAQ